MRKYLWIFLAFILTLSTAYWAGVTEDMKKQAQTLNWEFAWCTQTFNPVVLRISDWIRYQFFDYYNLIFLNLQIFLITLMD